MRTASIAVFLCAVFLAVSAQERTDDAVTRVIALEHAWNQAELRKDAKALDAIFDNALIYVDYDGTLKSKADFLARVKSKAAHPEQEITEAMTGYNIGATVVVTGIYMAKGMENGKPYVRQGRFVDTWINKDGRWVCVVSQSTPLLH